MSNATIVLVALYRYLNFPIRIMYPLLADSYFFIQTSRGCPYNRKQILQNIIWILAHNHAQSGTIENAVYNNSLGSKLLLTYLNLKSVVLAKQRV